MKTKLLAVSVLTLGMLGQSQSASAQLRYGKDYTTSDSVSLITNVKVDSNMMGYYLEGIKQTWVTGNEVAKELGHIEGWEIYQSELADSGHHNLTLVVNFKDMAQYEKGRTEFAAFEEAWLQKISREKSDEIVKSYPNVREIVGEYLVRRVEFK